VGDQHGEGLEEREERQPGRSPGAVGSQARAHARRVLRHRAA
jgi:hypothetical protein